MTVVKADERNEMRGFENGIGANCKPRALVEHFVVTLPPITSPALHLEGCF